MCVFIIKRMMNQPPQSRQMMVLVTPVDCYLDTHQRSYHLVTVALCV